MERKARRYRRRQAGEGRIGTAEEVERVKHNVG